MGLFNSLFGRKEEKKPNNTQQVSLTASVQVNTNSPNAAASSDVKEMVLLSMSEKFKVGETNYPGYLTYDYGIPFPNEVFEKLKSKGFICVSTAAESLSNYKVAELKEIATKCNVGTGGKKDALCQRLIEEIPTDVLEANVTERYWKITEIGRQELMKYPYIGYYMENHKYSLKELGYNIDELSKLCKGKNSLRIRDIMWGEFNRKTNQLYMEAVKNGNFHNYCDFLRAMALFLEEEGKYKDALAGYIRYLHYQLNFKASADTLKYYYTIKKINESYETFCMGSEMLPFMKKELLELNEECGFDSAQLNMFLSERFGLEKDEGFFTSQQMTNLVMQNLYGNAEAHRTICKEAFDIAKKRMQKK